MYSPRTLWAATASLPGWTTLALALVVGPSAHAADLVLSPDPDDPTATVGDFPSVQAALDAAFDGDVVHLTPGTYVVNLRFPRKVVRLEGEGPELTVLDGSACLTGAQACSVVAMDWADGGGEFSDAALRGLTLTGGEGTSDDLGRKLGGGLFSDGGGPDLEGVEISGNRATWGGGLFVQGARVNLVGASVRDNQATVGAGAYVTLGALRLTASEVVANSATQGGGLAVIQGELALSQVRVLGNTAVQGGGAYVDSPLPWTRAQRTGAAPEQLPDLAVHISHTTLEGNVASGDGGGLRLIYAPGVWLHNSLLALNLAATGANLSAVASPTLVDHCLFYMPDGRPGVDGLPEALAKVADPVFYDDARDGQSGDDDVHLRPGSPAIDAGADSRCLDADTDRPTRRCVDPDGSRPDLGAYGGSASPSRDNDADGMPDDWEATHGTDPQNPDGQDDPDGDGYTNAQEWAAGTDPVDADSDGDGLTDGEEVSAGTDPNNLSDPGLHPEAPGTVYVPQDFPTLQEAADAVGDGATIELAPGEYSGGMAVSWRSITLRGAGATVRGGGEGPVIELTATPAGTLIEGISIEGGQAENGGGLAITAGSVQLSGVSFMGGRASVRGGCLFASGADVIARGVSFDDCQAAAGGAAAAIDSHLELTDAAFRGSVASGEGGALYVFDGALTLTRATLGGEAGTFGGAVALTSSDAALTDVVLTGARAGRDGGGIDAQSSTLSARRLVVRGCEAGGEGGALAVSGGEATLYQAALVDNEAGGAGGGVSARAAAVSVTYTTMASNLSYGRGGALLLAEGTQADVRDSIFSHNRAAQGHNVSADGDLTYSWGRSLFWTPDGGDGLDGVSMPAAAQVGDPQLYDDPQDGTSEDDDVHLRPGSPAIDAGSGTCGAAGSPSVPCRDPDRSATDLGYYGGWGSNGVDQDRDGMADDWEAANGTLPTVGDAYDDIDADGLPNHGELAAGTSPLQPDSDGDGLTDGEEVASGSDPRDASSTGSGGRVVRVPQDFSTVGQALRAVRDGAIVEVEGGTHAPFALRWQAVTVRGVSGREQTVIDAAGEGPAASVTASWGAALSGLTLTGGHGEVGGGLAVALSAAALSDLTLSLNDAERGGGLGVIASEVELSDLWLTDNVARTSGAGAWIEGSSARLSRVTAAGNQADQNGGGVGISASEVVGQHLWLQGNDATWVGGGLYANGGALTLSQLVAWDNHGSTGGGAYVQASRLSLVQSTLYSNGSGGIGGGLASFDTCDLLMRNTITAFNDARTGANLYVVPRSGCAVPFAADHTLLWMVGGGAGLSGVGVPTGTLVADPRLLDDRGDGNPGDDDLHLQAGSPARDAGASAGCLDEALGELSAACLDPDGGAADLGAFGGPLAGGWDVDGDGADGWWWTAGYMSPPSGIVGGGFDCDDGDPLVGPGEAERLNGLDDDCDGQVDEP